MLLFFPNSVIYKDSFQLLLKTLHFLLSCVILCPTLMQFIQVHKLFPLRLTLIKFLCSSCTVFSQVSSKKAVRSRATESRGSRKLCLLSLLHSHSVLTRQTALPCQTCSSHTGWKGLKKRFSNKCEKKMNFSY